MTELTHDRLLDLLTYNPDNGQFRWHKLTYSGQKRVAGFRYKTARKQWYKRIKIDGKAYMAHRLAWFYMEGSWPTGALKPVNGDYCDTRWFNIVER